MTESMRLHDQAQQVRRVARVLGVKPEELAELQHIPADQLRQLHDQCAAWLFNVHADSFARVAAVSKVIPGALAGKMAEKFLDPALAARAAVMLDPAKASDLVNKVSVSYLADVALSLDPVRGTPVIKAIPPRRVAEVAKALFDRDELAAMAEFAGSVDKPALDAALRVASPSQLVRVAPLLSWNDNIEEIIDELDADRMDAILTAIADDELWVEASVLLRRLRVETLARVVERLKLLPGVAAKIPTDLVGELAVDLFETGELDTMILFVPVVPDEALTRALEVAGGANLLKIAPLLEWTERVHEIVENLTDDQLDRVLHDMAADGLWAEAAVLLHEVPQPTLARVAGRLRVHAGIADQIPADLIRGMATDLFAADQLDAMVLFVPVVSAAALTAAIEAAGATNLLRIAPRIEWSDKIVNVLEAMPDNFLDAILAEVVEANLIAEGEALVERLDADLRARIVARMRAAPTELLARMKEAVAANTSSPTLRELIAAVESANP